MMKGHLKTSAKRLYKSTKELPKFNYLSLPFFHKYYVISIRFGHSKVLYFEQKFKIKFFKTPIKCQQVR